MTGKRHKRREGLGSFTIPAIAAHLNIPVGQIRRAVKRGEIKTVSFAGLERIPPTEVARVKELFDCTSKSMPPRPRTVVQLHDEVSEAKKKQPRSLIKQRLSLIEQRISVIEQRLSVIERAQNKSQV